MKIRVTTFFRALLCSIFLPAVQAVYAEGDTLIQRDCHIDGIRSKAVCYSVDVPVDYDDPASGTISIEATVLPAKGTHTKVDPLVVFTGGPGQGGSGYGPFVRASFDGIWKERDIVLVDQRGTGRSHPVTCSAYIDTDPTQLDWQENAAACRAATTLPVESFTLENVVRDTRYVIDLLGYDQVNLWGGSYGTRTVARFYRRYPDKVRAFIADGVLPAETALYGVAAEYADRALKKLFVDCNAAPACHAAFPELGAVFERLRAQFTAGPVTATLPDPLSGAPVTLVMHLDLLENIVRSTLYSAEQAALLPYAISEAEAGNFAPMFALYTAGTQVTDTMAVGATLSILCAEEVPRLTNTQAVKAGTGRFTGDSYYRFWSSACAGWPMPAVDGEIYTPASGAVPALILSGDLDPITPPPLGDILLKGFPAGRHLIVPNTGHNTSHISCMPDLLAEFLNTLDAAALDATCLDRVERPAFVTSGLGITVQSED